MDSSNFYRDRLQIKVKHILLLFKDSPVPKKVDHQVITEIPTIILQSSKAQTHQKMQIHSKHQLWYK